MRVANAKDAAARLMNWINARNAVIGILSHEESRVMRSLGYIAAKTESVLIEWDSVSGVYWEADIDFDGVSVGELVNAQADPVEMLQFILSQTEAGGDIPLIFVLKDIHVSIEQDTLVRRYLRTIRDRLEISRHTLVLLSPSMNIPAELEKTIALLDWPLPDYVELSDLLSQAENAIELPVELDDGSRREIIQSLQGLTEMEATNLLSSAISLQRGLNVSVVPYIISEKAQIIKRGREGVLEYIPPTTEENDVGGLKKLRTYCQMMRGLFGEEARAAKVDAPKGILLVGPPGTGKSLSAKATAGTSLPLVRLNIGNAFSKYVGESEASLRDAIKLAEAISPCVLWIDELDKALGSGVAGGESHEVTDRMIGTLLTWIEEKTKPVYIVATANYAERIDDPLLQRFDKVWQVGLPAHEARKEIMRIHLQKRGISSDTYPLDELAELTWGYAGREIERAIREAKSYAFMAGHTDHIPDDMLITSLQEIRPMKKHTASTIKEIEKWCESNGAVMAGEPLEVEPKKALINKDSSSRGDALMNRFANL